MREELVRGTTPVHIFNLPFDVDIIQEVRIAYTQDEDLILVKQVKDCELSGRTIRLNLSEEDTRLFNPKKQVEIRLRVLLVSGEVVPSNVIRILCSKCLDCEVMTHGI